LDAFFPIRFSRDRIEAVIARVKAQTPEAIELLAATKRDVSWSAIWSEAVAQELETLGISSDPMLVRFLVSGHLQKPSVIGA